ncbi:MAG: tRNA pseudouridine(55) synthase TruB [Puniceicoccaceae bacterium]
MPDRSPTELEGVLLVDKPPEWTSHDVVAKCRRIFGIRKIGHAGTLDPMATGLLVVLIGKGATKASQFLISLDKAYEGTIYLGRVTDSQDADGEILEEREVAPFPLTEIENTFEKFIGDQYQIPPMFSAKKVQGVPLYKMARKGQEIEREPRFIRVESLDLLSYQHPEITFSCAVSKGTYVRTLAHDIGQILGSGATLTSLRRTRIDSLEVSRAYTIDALTALPPSQLGRVLIPIHKVVPSHVL